MPLKGQANTDYQRNWKRNQRKWVSDMKAGRPCTDCGGVFHPAAMDFDHVVSDKKLCMSQVKRMTWDEVEAELAKCELVCANCHRVRTYNRQQEDIAKNGLVTTVGPKARKRAP